MPAVIPVIIGAAAWAGRLALSFGRFAAPPATAQTIINTVDPAEVGNATIDHRPRHSDAVCSPDKPFG
jgi:hypothetical protein